MGKKTMEKGSLIDREKPNNNGVLLMRNVESHVANIDRKRNSLWNAEVEGNVKRQYVRSGTYVSKRKEKKIVDIFDSRSPSKNYFTSHSHVHCWHDATVDSHCGRLVIFRDRKRQRKMRLHEPSKRQKRKKTIHY